MTIPIEVLITIIITIIASGVGVAKWVVSEIKNEITLLFEKSDDHGERVTTLETKVDHIEKVLEKLL